MVDDSGNSLPTCIMEFTSHSMWVNSEALRRAGITKDTPDPQGGVIMRNANGEPNGILLENAGNLMMEMALDPTMYPEVIRYNREGLEWALGLLAKNGITSVVDAR